MFEIEIKSQEIQNHNVLKNCHKPIMESNTLKSIEIT